MSALRVNIGNRPLIEAKVKGCQVREWIVGERDMSFSRIVYMICVNGGYLVSDIFNTIDRQTWREIKETLQWPPMENQLVVYTQHRVETLIVFRPNLKYYFIRYYYILLN